MNGPGAELPPDLLPPDYTGAWIGAVLPAVADSLGLDLRATTAHSATTRNDDGDGHGASASIPLPPARHAVVVLIDGLGAAQLERWGGHAPFLRSIGGIGRSGDADAGEGSGTQAPREGVFCAFPSTTATSTASLGTGLTPGVHGLTGWQTRDPATGTVFNHLSWDGGPDPLSWQPHPTLFERIVAAGGRAIQISKGAFETSGLTRSALRGTDYRAADSLEDRVAGAIAAAEEVARASSASPALIYCYFGEVDKAGHVYGPGSWQWGQAMEQVDAAVAAIAAGLPDGVSLTVTADHGMVDAPEVDRVDLAWYPELTSGVVALGGEARGPQLYTTPGAASDVQQSWAEFLGDRAVVLSREVAIDLGLFGAVEASVAPRIGDVIALMRGTSTVVHSGVMRPQVVSLIGHHGSLTREEILVPLLHRPG